MDTVTILIPMAGRGQRFVEAGYVRPKPFIEINGRPMIEHVLENLSMSGAQFIAVIQEDHLYEEGACCKELQLKYNLKFLPINLITEGALCTCLFAHRELNNDSPLLIANCDQLIDIDVKLFIKDCKNRKLDGSILTFYAQDPKWSYAKVGSAGLVEEVKEKIVISDEATVGLYLFSSAKEFVSYAIDMIIRNERVNGEFYVCPVFSGFIRDGKRIGTYKILESQMFGIGTPGDLIKYCALKNLSFTQPSTTQQHRA